MVTLVRAPMAPPRAWDTDPCQEAVLADRSAVLRVLGGPGTGKTTLAARIVAERGKSPPTPASCWLPRAGPPIGCATS